VRMPKKFLLLSWLLLCAGLVRAQSEEARWAKWETEADTLMAREQFAEAAGLYSKIISESKLTEKDQYKTLYKRAICYYRIGELNKCLADLNRYLPEFPDNPKPHILRALVYRQQNDLANQLADLQKAIITLKGAAPELARWRGALLLEQGDFEGAKKDFLSVAITGDDAEVETNLGVVYYSLGKPDSALSRINKAIVIDVNYPSSYVYAGTICLQEENYPLALKYLRLGLRVDPDNRNAQFYTGVALVELDQTEEGCRYLRKAFAAGEDEAAGYLKRDCFDVEK